MEESSVNSKCDKSYWSWHSRRKELMHKVVLFSIITIFHLVIWTWIFSEANKQTGSSFCKNSVSGYKCVFILVLFGIQARKTVGWQFASQGEKGLPLPLEVQGWCVWCDSVKYCSGNSEDCSASIELPFNLFINMLADYLRGHEAVADAGRWN